MKYYDQLSDLESELIRLETLSSLVSVISCGFENYANPKDLQNTMYILEENIQSINDNLRSKFDDLWSCVRDDSDIMDDEFDEEDDQKELDFGDQTNYDFQPLDTVMDKWAKS
jgi:hypothetical protein